MKKIITILCLIIITSFPAYADYFDMFMDHGAIMLIVDSEDGSIHFANHAASNFYGYSLDQLMAMNISDINNLSPKEVEREYQLAAKEERNFFEFDHILRSGEIKQVAVYSYPVTFNGKERLFSIVIDMTEQNENQAKLAHAQERNEASLKQIIVIISTALLIILFLLVRLMIFNKRLKYLTDYDSLAKVYNRQAFVNKYINLKDRDFPLFFCMMDVNNLKFINDTFGHIKGDKMIVAVAENLRHLSQNKLVIGRVSGDEFVGFMINSSDEFAEDLKTKIENMKVKIEGIDFNVSVGCLKVEEINHNFKNVFSLAEKKMYKNKLAKKPISNQRILDQLLYKLYRLDPSYAVKNKEITLIVDLLMEVIEFEDVDLSHLYEACLYQDLGVLADFEDLREHPQKTYGILNALNIPPQVSTVCFYHHEAYDGSGFPKGLKGEDIPYNARILTLVNGLYDILKNNKDVYQIKQSGKYDPELVEKLFDNPYFMTKIEKIEREII